MVFGFEDALVSTTGVVVGVGVGVESKQVIILAGIVTVVVEALSMGVGQYLSEKSAHEISIGGHKDNLFVGGLLMFFSYALAGIVPIVPIIIFHKPVSLIGAALASFLALFLLGFVKGKVVRRSPWKSAMEMLLVGGVAALVGIIVGIWLKV